MNYYISDYHIGHANVIRFDGRPFLSTEQMLQIIVENWRHTVKPEDTVYILGDFCWAKEQDWPQYLELFPGHKVLIRGNHDPKGFSKKTRSYFDDIKDYKEIRDGGRHVILSHYPIPFHRRAYDPDTWMLYGHVHNTRENDFMRNLRSAIRATCQNPGDCRGNWINVGCMMPYMDYTPRTLDELIRFSEEEV